MQVFVGQLLSVDVTTTKASLPVGDTASLAASAVGGTTPYTYAWTVLDPTGADDTATAIDSASIAGPTFTAPANAGTYRITCTVTDSVGATFAASLHIYVGTLGLTADVTTTKVSLPVGQTATLTATGTGGSVPYSYAWTVLNPSGGDASASLSSTTVASPTFTAPATPGTYRCTCVVGDSGSQTFTASLHIYVGTPLSATVTTTKQTMTTGDTATLTAGVTGGVSGYTYAWSILDPSGGNADAALSSTSVAAPTFTAPLTGGTYRCTCTVTDSAGATFAAATHVYVTTAMLTLTTPAAADGSANPTSILTATAFGNISTVVEVNTNLTYARNLLVRLNDPDGNLDDGTWVTIDGVGADGHPQSENFKFNLTGITSTTVQGSKPFSRVELVRYLRIQPGSSNPNGDETVQIGIGSIFGLPEILSSASSVRAVILAPNTTLADHTVITTPGRQGVDFSTSATPPDGARSYYIYYDDN